MLLADESLRSDEGKKGKDGKSSAEELVKNFLQIHESCSEKDAAPRRYMTFLKTYKQVHNEKKDGVVKRQQHLQVRVSQLLMFFWCFFDELRDVRLLHFYLFICFICFVGLNQPERKQ